MTNCLRFIVLLTLFCSTFTVHHAMPMHEFYISMTQVDYDQDAQSLEITMKLFIDDLENAMRMIYQDSIFLGEQYEIPNANELLEDYLDTHFGVIANETTQDAVFIGKEVEQEVIWCYIEITNVTELQSLEIENNILLDFLDKQTNLVHVEVDGKIQSHLFKKGDTQKRFKF